MHKAAATVGQVQRRQPRLNVIHSSKALPRPSSFYSLRWPPAMTANGAGAAGPTPSAAAAGSAAAGGLAAWWANLVSTNRPVVEQKVKGALSAVQKTKFSMPVDVKVDFLNPTIETVKQSLNSAWSQLPPPVQQVAPYAACAASGGLVVFVIQQRRLALQRQRNAELELKVSGLQKERTQLLQRVNTLKANRAPRTEVEARLANAVAEATNAAAAAADAAARAATACIIQRP